MWEGMRRVVKLVLDTQHLFDLDQAVLDITVFHGLHRIHDIIVTLNSVLQRVEERTVCVFTVAFAEPLNVDDRISTRVLYDNFTVLVIDECGVVSVTNFERDSLSGFLRSHNCGSVGLLITPDTLREE